MSMKEQKILITGGRGKTGRRVIERLEQLGHRNIRVGSRSQMPKFDWYDPNTWQDAIEDVDTVYITYQPDLAVPGTSDIIQAFAEMASSRGVRKMVLLSGRGESESQKSENIVKATAKHWTIVRASWFNQNFSESFFLDPILAGHVALPRAEALEPFTDADDIADVVVKCLLEDTHDKQTYELTGPHLLTFGQAIQQIATVTNRNIAFQSLTIDEYTQQLRDYQVPDDHIWLINYLFTEVLDGRNASITNDIEKVLGRKPKDFSQYALETANQGVWNVRSVAAI